ncbi:MAG: SDR family oxidoreductase, partial [Anaerolineales bacterium]
MTLVQRFEDKIVLVTGSGRGIGSEIALQFARSGADIIVNFFRNRQPAEKTAEQIRQLGRRCLVVKANVGNPQDLDRLFDTVQAEFGGLDIFISNAASGYNRPAMAQKVNGWDWTMNINARAFLFGAQHAVPLMEARGGGAMVCISSPGSSRVIPDYIVVGASKAALEAVTRYLAVELAADDQPGPFVSARPGRRLLARAAWAACPGRGDAGHVVAHHYDQRADGV